MLNELFRKCKDYSYHECYVYTLCNNVINEEIDKSKKWLVVMTKLEKTKTNEDRKYVTDKSHALFRADILKVIKIINILDAKIEATQIIHRDYYDDDNNNNTKYEVNELVKTKKYEMNPAKIKACGIYYFTTLEPAYYFREIPKNYNGVWMKWNNFGNKISEETFVNGIKEGISISWFPNTEKTEKNYKDGKLHGKYITWYPNGLKHNEYNFKNGMKDGQYNVWYDTGEKKMEGKYDNGTRCEYILKWHKNGKMAGRGTYENGRKTGVWITWYDNEQKESETKYNEKGKIHGPYTEWYRNGKKSMKTFFSHGYQLGTLIEWNEAGIKMVYRKIY